MPPTDERSLGQLFAELTRDIRTLIQQEVQLAKTELGEKSARARNGVALIVGGGSAAYAGFLAIIAGCVLGLTAVGLPHWAAALLTGVVVAGAGYILVRAGLAAIRPRTLVPHQTIETLKEDAQWLKNETR